jgi:hypothetical protein
VKDLPIIKILADEHLSPIDKVILETAVEQVLTFFACFCSVGHFTIEEAFFVTKSLSEKSDLMWVGLASLSAHEQAQRSAPPKPGLFG